MSESLMPKIKKSIEDFLYEEEGNITRNRVLMIGSMMLIMGAILSIDVFAAHGSHKSHSSHKSHRSHSSHSSGAYHRSHVSHTSHSSSTHNSHSSGHSSHSSHSNVTHSNVAVPVPSMDGVVLKTPPVTPELGLNESLKTQFILPDTPKIK